MHCSLCAGLYAAPIVYGGSLLAGLPMGMFICIAVHMIRDLSFSACFVIVLRSIARCTRDTLGQAITACMHKSN